MKTVRIEFGTRFVSDSVNDSATIAQCLTEDAKAYLGCPDNVRCTVNGVEVSMSCLAPEANIATVVLETKANEKAIS